MFWNCSDSLVSFGTVLTVLYVLDLFLDTRLSEQFQNIQDYQNSFKRYKTVRIVPKYTRLSEQFQKIQDCQNSSKTYKTVRTVPKDTRLSEQFQNIQD
jgi:hypothetical protein